MTNKANVYKVRVLLPFGAIAGSGNLILARIVVVHVLPVLKRPLIQIKPGLFSIQVC
jgi:hypothetical protein